MNHDTERLTALLDDAVTARRSGDPTAEISALWEALKEATRLLDVRIPL